MQNPSILPTATLPQHQARSSPASPKFAPPPRLGAKPVPSASFNTPAFSSTSHSRQSSGNPGSLMQPLQPPGTGGSVKPSPPTPSLQQQMQRPNYNIALPTVYPTPTPPPTIPMMPTPAQPTIGSNLPPPLASMSSPPLFAAQPAMGSLLAPSKPPQQPWNVTKKSKNSDWGDFDPLA